MAMTFAGFRLLLFLAWTVAMIGAAAFVTHRFDASAITKLELAYATAQAEAVASAQAEQKRVDDIARQAAEDEATHQQAIAVQTAARLREVQSHVHVQTITRGCITYGLVRVLDAAVHGVPAGSLTLAPAGADDHCTKLTAVDLANSVVANYGACRANSEQLGALISVERAMRVKK